MPFFKLTVEGYGDDDVVNLASLICIRSPLALSKDVWYRLGEPSAEYRRFYDPYIYLATFTKFFVEYLDEHEKVTLEHFRSKFRGWLESRYGKHDAFRLWHEKCKLRDFCTTVTAHVGYLYKEAYNVDSSDHKLLNQPIWDEIGPGKLTAIEEEPKVHHQTIVTPYAHECFKHMYFAGYLERKASENEAVLRSMDERKQELRLTPCSAQPVLKKPNRIAPLDQSASIQAGDVVSVRPDNSGKDTKWESSSTVWYAHVQKVRPTNDGDVLDALWLYEPADTTLGAANYLFKNELFMSDNCTCRHRPIHVESVTGKVNVKWFETDPNATTGLFVRQKFRHVKDEQPYDFQKLRETDFSCGCTSSVPAFKECMSKYNISDTVLVQERDYAENEDVLQPAQIVGFDADKRRGTLRRLEYRQLTDPKAPPNELITTPELFYKAPSKIVRKCHVRVLGADDLHNGRPPFPFDRNGAGDCFFTLSDAALDAEPTLPTLHPGWNPSLPCSKTPLSGMGIFGGGGNFDRGLAEGGAVKFKYAVDWAKHALHSYKANVEDSDVQYILGSVNDYLAQAIAGSDELNIARIGSVDFISAGSPCPGFSNMQQNKQSDDAKSMASMVASVVSYADFYSPRYLVLENVVSMANKIKGAGEAQNVFRQVLAALVGLGYQIQQFNMDAWNYGSPQRRSRLFIVASAPGLDPLPAPPHTHGHPRRMPMSKQSLGKAGNGKAFAERRNDLTPFSHISTSDATGDLPYIADAQAQICPAFPDHRPSTEEVTTAGNVLQWYQHYRMVRVSSKQLLAGALRQTLSQLASSARQASDGSKKTAKLTHEYTRTGCF